LFCENAVVLRGVAAVTYVARNPCTSVNIVLPELANLVFGCEVALQALCPWKILSPGIGWKILSPGIGWKSVSPDVGAQCYAHANESRCKDLHHAVCPR
jgi:hypothetical protein